MGMEALAVYGFGIMLILLLIVTMLNTAGQDSRFTTTQWVHGLVIPCLAKLLD